MVFKQLLTFFKVCCSIGSKAKPGEAPYLQLVRLLIVADTLAYCSHRYRKAKIDCLSFVMCPLLAQPIIAFFSFFLLWPFTVLMKQTRQAVHAIKQSIILSCLWLHCIIAHLCYVFELQAPDSIRSLFLCIKFIFVEQQQKMIYNIFCNFIFIKLRRYSRSLLRIS